MKFKTYFIKTIFSILVFTTFQIGVTDAKVKSEPTKYIVGVEYTNAHPNYSFERNTYNGMLKEIMEKFSQEHNVTFEYVAFPINELFRNFYGNEFDFKIPDNPTWRASDKKLHNVIYSDPIYSYIDGVFVLDQHSRCNIDQIKTLGVASEVIMWSLQNYVQEKKIILKRASTCGELLTDLQSGNIDGIVCNYLTMRNELKKRKLTNITLGRNLPFLDEYYHLSTIKHPNVIKEFNIWLSKNEPFVKKLVQNSF